MNARKWIRWLLVILAIDLVLGAAVYVTYDRYREHRFDPIILDVSQKYGVDPCLVKAVIWRETKFDPHVVGRAGEIGLMQVMPETGQDWAKAVGRPRFSPSDLFDARTNIEVGAWYLARGLNYWKDADDPLPFALAEYNAGRGNVRKWLQPDSQHDAQGFIESIGITSTKRYVQDVLRRHEHYKQRGEFRSRQSTPSNAPNR